METPPRERLPTMSRPTTNCPSCGAPVEFRWSSSVQTTCDYCHSILVRTDVDLHKVGQVADLPLDASPIQIATEGVYDNKAFVVAGRIIYEYDQGSWNEWHIVFQDGASGWLADAQLEYDVSFGVVPPLPLPPAGQVRVGAPFTFNRANYEVTSRTMAHYRGVEGELPFEYWDKHDVLFVDLRTHEGGFGTIDYSDDPPSLYLGRPVDFDVPQFKNLRSFEGWT
jgi:Domain of unknown function (DUF4178)